MLIGTLKLAKETRCGPSYLGTSTEWHPEGRQQQLLVKPKVLREVPPVSDLALVPLSCH